MQTKRNAVAAALAAALAASLCTAFPARAEEPAAGMTTVVPGDKPWERHRAMPDGMRIMFVYGDPAKPGPYVYRVRVPTGYKWPPMKYPDERVTTVLKGTLWMAQGERYDAMRMKELRAGALFVTPASTPHFQWARTEVILQVLGTGPVDNPVTYVDPHDDPRVE